jgi:tetratricopeptide (TPR) repeat protein
VFDTTYTFTLEKEGNVTIPAMTVHLGNLKGQTNPITVKAFKRRLMDGSGKTIPLDDLLFATASLAPGKEKIYVGEEVPLEIRMYSIKGLDASPSAWPVLNLENIITRDYSSVNPDSPHFLPSPRKNEVDVQERAFNVVTFKCRIRAISPGALSGTVNIPCVIRIPTDSRSRRRTGDPFDDFFSGGLFTSRYKNAKYNLTAQVKRKTVLPLPKPPENSTFLGLIGDWKVKYAMTSTKLKVGEAVTLKISLVGTGTLDSLAPPKLNLDDFRVYPPETKKSPSTNESGFDKASIQYALIPLKPGKTTLKLPLTTFSPKKGNYTVWKMEKTFDVAKSNHQSFSIVDGSIPSQNNMTNHSKNASSDILYLKKEGMGKVDIPLIKNKLHWIILLAIFGPICLALSEFMTWRRGRLSENPALKRKINARKRRGAVIAKLKKAASPDILAEVARNDVTTLLNDLLGFPPGTSAEELAKKIDDPELADCLQASSSSSYMPGNNAAIPPNEVKKKLLRALKKVSTLFAATFILATASTSAYASKNTEKEEWKAYDHGNPETTEHFYENKLDLDNPDPAWLYNLGNCEVKRGNLPKALVFYERARRLAPNDSDILENLNYTRRKLMLPEVGTAKTPLDSLLNMRDSLRTDSWVLIASALWTVSWLILAFRRKLSTRQWVSALVATLLLLNIATIAIITQKASTYNTGTAIVVEKHVIAHPLPSADEAGFKVRPGEEVRIEEKRHDWLRIRAGNAEGWVKPEDVEQLWPYND